jgi:prepilin-type N-terminal cleavage/methylation domain-containing protein
MSTRPADDGFTLIEALVGLVLLGLIMALIGVALRFSGSALERATVADRGASFAAVRGFLEQRLAEAIPVFGQDASGRVRIAFAGRADALSFVAPLERGPAGPGLYRFDLEEDRSAGTDRVTLRLAMRLHHASAGAGAATTAEPAEERALIGGLAGVRFRYFGWPQGRGAPVWQESWERPEAMPELVELHLVLPEGDPRPWTPLVVELRLRSGA